MIKIDIQQETSTLSKNPIIKEFFNTPTINLQQRYVFTDISFYHLNQMLERLSPGYDDVIIAVVCSRVYDDLLIERAAPRMYDSSSAFSGSELSFNTQRGIVRIIFSDLMDKDGVLFLNPDNKDVLKNSTISIKTSQLEFTQSTDFSTVKFKITHATKFNNDK